MTLKYRWSLTTSFVCSALVAVLWSLNLGAIYPFVEIAMQGRSLHQWLEVEEEKSQELIAKSKPAFANQCRVRAS